MATGPGVSQGKTAFLEEFLPDNRDATLVEANQAWTAAGNEGTLSESLFGKTRSRLGLTGRKGRDGGATREKAGPSAKGKSKGASKGAMVKRASRAEAFLSQPDGQEGDKGPSKSSFVEEVLGRESGANLRAVNEAWASAGHEGVISPSIYYKIKRELGVTGEPSPGESTSVGEPGAGLAVGGSEGAPQLANGRGAPIATAAAGPKVSGDMVQVVDEVEAGIDDLMFTLKVNGGMPEVEAALRAARRLLVRSQEG